MKNGKTNAHDLARLITRPFVKKARAGWLVLMALLFLSTTNVFSAPPALTEYQVKALCLLNFAKYTEWPTNASANTNAPISIGIIGESPFGTSLQAATSGKTIAGRAVIIRELTTEADYDQCQILFVCASDAKRIPEILGRVKNNSILTVGETEQFLPEGGVINFAVRSGKVRFDISLDSAHRAGLKLSSKVLSLADHVLGNP